MKKLLALILVLVLCLPAMALANLGRSRGKTYKIGGDLG